MEAHTASASLKLAPRRVRGAFFVDYVRMVKRQRAGDSPHLWPEDREYLVGRIDAGEWYPMATFERLGLAILEAFSSAVHAAAAAEGTAAPVSLLAVSPEPVRMFGRMQMVPIAKQFPGLIVERSPRETLMRFRVLLSSFFDFPALDVLSINDTSAEVTIDYGMCAAAERAASWQTLGAFESLLAMAGAPHHHCEMMPRPWDAAGKVTRLRLAWVDARRPAARKTGPADIPPEELVRLTPRSTRPTLSEVPLPTTEVERSAQVVGDVSDGGSAPVELLPEHRKDR